jgi:hypothetical protein
VVPSPHWSKQLEIWKLTDLLGKFSPSGLLELGASSGPKPNLKPVTRISVGHQRDAVCFVDDDDLRRDAISHAFHKTKLPCTRITLFRSPLQSSDVCESRPNDGAASIHPRPQNTLETNPFVLGQCSSDGLTYIERVWIRRRAHQAVPVDDPCPRLHIDLELDMCLVETSFYRVTNEVLLGEVRHRV